MNTEKKLYRSRNARMVAGVCGGLGKFFGIDPTIIRIIYIVLSLFTTAFPGIILYVILMLVIPEEPLVDNSGYHPGADNNDQFNG